MTFDCSFRTTGKAENGYRVGSLKVMKKLLQIFAFFVFGIAKVGSAQPQTQTTLPDLNGVTFGFGAGYAHSFDKTYDYSLSTDGNHNLILQPLNKQSFVISSVIMFKLGKLSIDPATNALIKQSKKATYFAMKKANALRETASDIAKPSFLDHLSLNASLDLVNVAPNVSFNKNINGGLGVGYFFNDNCQLALFYDISSISQLRDYIVNIYQNKPIPNGSGTNYTALDPNDNNLFYNRTISGFSVKLIFSLGNQKASTPPTSD